MKHWYLVNRGEAVDQSYKLEAQTLAQAVKESWDRLSEEDWLIFTDEENFRLEFNDYEIPTNWERRYGFVSGMWLSDGRGGEDFNDSIYYFTNLDDPGEFSDVLDYFDSNRCFDANGNLLAAPETEGAAPEIVCSLEDLDAIPREMD